MCWHSLYWFPSPQVVRLLPSPRGSLINPGLPIPLHLYSKCSRAYLYVQFLEILQIFGHTKWVFFVLFAFLTETLSLSPVSYLWSHGMYWPFSVWLWCEIWCRGTTCRTVKLLVCYLNFCVLPSLSKHTERLLFSPHLKQFYTRKRCLICSLYLIYVFQYLMPSKKIVRR